jgi:L-cysteine:1D-myo-inositol 2-amino-2-deoxy-alpha-D-glucopyranoside ligase
MQLFDTLRGEKAQLEVPSDRPITLYVCGVTPYDTTHVGHAHTFLIFDLLIRYLNYRGAEVRYCQNVTDVDTPLFERAARDNVPWDELARRETAQFVKDCADLNMIAPTYYPKASEEIPLMLTIVERLIEQGHAYERNGSVYFSIKTDPDYGAMTRLGYADMLAIANERGNDPNDPNKVDPLDFVLWQAAAPGEPTWESPWGPGRPGWHIECTTMSTRYLGEQIDIHGGGRDLIFPHHPSEIAQTEAYSGKKPFVRFWMHGGMAFLGGEKMSKSLGNMVFIREALNEHSADAIRWYLLSFPYRDDFHYERDGVLAAEAQVERMYSALAAVGGGAPASTDGSAEQNAFFAALDDDLHSPAALAQIDTLAQRILGDAAADCDVAAAQNALRTIAQVFGFKEA